MAFGRVDETDGHLVRKARAECCHVTTFESPVPPNSLEEGEQESRREQQALQGHSVFCLIGQGQVAYLPCTLVVPGRAFPGLA